MNVEKMCLEGPVEVCQVVELPNTSWQSIPQTGCVDSKCLLTNTLLVQWLIKRPYIYSQGFANDSLSI